MIFSKSVKNFVYMLFAEVFVVSLLRLRIEINRLVIAQSSKVKDPTQAAAYQSGMFEILLQSLSVRIPTLSSIQF